MKYKIEIFIAIKIVITFMSISTRDIRWICHLLLVTLLVVQNYDATALRASVNVAQTIFIVWVGSHKVYPVGSRSVVSYKKPQLDRLTRVTVWTFDALKRFLLVCYRIRLLTTLRFLHIIIFSLSFHYSSFYRWLSIQQQTRILDIE